MSRLALTLARLCLSAWVGAAVLFVINGVRLVTHARFDSLVRNQLVLIRFPAYYALGFSLVGLSLAALLLAGRGSGLPRRRRRIAAPCAAAALVLMTVDYTAVYQPLAAMLHPPEAPRPAEFIGYHRVSELINGVHVGLALCAAVLASVPTRPGAEPPA
jgi:hypothetical protein